MTATLRCQAGTIIATYGFGCHAAGLTEAPHPMNNRADAKIEQCGGLPARQPAFNRRYNTFAQIFRIRLRHSCWPPSQWPA